MWPFGAVSVIEPPGRQFLVLALAADGHGVIGRVGERPVPELGLRALFQRGVGGADEVELRVLALHGIQVLAHVAAGPADQGA